MKRFAACLLTLLLGAHAVSVSTAHAAHIGAGSISELRQQRSAPAPSNAAEAIALAQYGGDDDDDAAPAPQHFGGGHHGGGHHHGGAGAAIGLGLGIIGGLIQQQQRAENQRKAREHRQNLHDQALRDQQLRDRNRRDEALRQQRAQQERARRAEQAAAKRRADEQARARRNEQARIRREEQERLRPQQQAAPPREQPIPQPRNAVVPPTAPAASPLPLPAPAPVPVPAPPAAMPAPVVPAAAPLMPVSPRPPDPAPDPAALPHELGCPDDFQRFRVGETRLHPYRTNYPAEARFCTGTTAKGCYLRVMNGPAMCGSKPACVMHCPHPVAVPAPVPVLIPVPAPIPVAPQPARAAEAKGAITAEGCETRLAVMGETGAIYFRTGSAELDDASQPLLDSGADIARRCPTVKFEVEGHTDSVGSKRLNQTLSEERAASVVTYLAGKGVAADRIRSVGHGDTRPVARNSSEANRAKNRRIEFKVNGN